MKYYENLEEIYSEILKDCVSLFSKSADLNLSLLDISIEIGRRIHRLIILVDDPDAMLRRLSRDISRARKKVVTYNKLQRYCQLYLFFTNSGEDLYTITNRFGNDISAETLLKISSKYSDSNKSNEKKENIHPILVKLSKIIRMLDKIQSSTESEQLSTDLLSQIIEQLNSIQQKTREISKCCKGYKYVYQTDLFSTPEIE